MDIAGYGTVSVEHGHRDVTTRVRSRGTLDVPSGSWRVQVRCTDEHGNATTVRSSATVDGPGALEVPDVDHIAYRHDRPSVIHTAVVLHEWRRGGWEPVTAETVREPLEELPPVANPPRWGVHLVPTEYGETATPRDAWRHDLDAQPGGLTCVRMGLAWHGLQPNAKGVWDEAKARHVDAVLAELGDRGLSVALAVGTTPEWAGDAPYGAPDDVRDMGDWVRDIIDRWGEVVPIEFIDVWNEPNLSFNGTLGQVGAMVGAAHAAADGDVPIYLSPQSLVATHLLDDLVDGGELTDADFDGIDLHPYPISFAARARWEDAHHAVNDLDRRPGSPLSSIHVVQDWMAARGFSPKPIAISEIGASRYPVGDDPLLRITDERSAAWHRFLLDRLARIEDVTLVSVHEGADAAGLVENASWNAAWGLVDEDGVRRRKWQAVADIVGTG